VANAKHASLLRQKVKNFAAKSFFFKYFTDGEVGRCQGRPPALHQP